MKASPFTRFGRVFNHIQTLLTGFSSLSVIYLKKYNIQSDKQDIVQIQLYPQTY